MSVGCRTLTAAERSPRHNDDAASLEHSVMPEFDQTSAETRSPTRPADQRHGHMARKAKPRAPALSATNSTAIAILPAMCAREVDDLSTVTPPIRQNSFDRGKGGSSIART